MELGLADGRIHYDPFDPIGPLQSIIEPLLGTHVMVLEVQQQDPRIIPATAFSVHVRFNHLPLGDPVEPGGRRRLEQLLPTMARNRIIIRSVYLFGESLVDAVIREAREETSLDIEPVALAGHREVIMRDKDGQIERHFVILSFASRWLKGEPVLNSELDDARWVDPGELPAYKTTEGLAEIVTAAAALVAATA